MSLDDHLSLQLLAVHLLRASTMPPFSPCTSTGSLATPWVVQRAGRGDDLAQGDPRRRASTMLITWESLALKTEVLPHLPLGCGLATSFSPALRRWPAREAIIRRSA